MCRVPERVAGGTAAPSELLELEDRVKPGHWSLEDPGLLRGGSARAGALNDSERRATAALGEWALDEAGRALLMSEGLPTELLEMIAQ